MSLVLGRKIATMSCWVVPTVAAEIWGMPVEHVLGKIDSGEIPHRRDNGWIFVDVAPDSPVVVPLKRHPSERPPTFTLITFDELEALSAIATPPEEDAHPDPHPEVSTFKNWHTARQRTSRLRVPPARFANA